MLSTALAILDRLDTLSAYLYDGNLNINSKPIQELKPELQEAKIVYLNSLNEESYQRTMWDPDKSELHAYEILFK